MRWRSDKAFRGEKRGRWRFAWFPVRCAGNVTVWWEEYYVEEIYEPHDGHPEGSRFADWRVIGRYASTVTESGIKPLIPPVS